MKLALIIDNNIEFAPYIYSYYELLKDKYHDIDVLIWNRNQTSYNYEHRFKVIDIIKSKDSKNKAKLFINKYKFCRLATKFVKKNNYDRVIVFNEDIFLLLGNIKNLILDNRDLKLIRNNIKLEKYFKKKLEKLDAVVHASDGFKEYYEKRYNYNNNYIFYNIPHDLEEYIKNNKKQLNIKKNTKLTIGFIGVIRYKEQLKCLINCANKRNINVKISGGGKDFKEILDYSKKYNNVFIEGKFKIEDTLKKYENVDIIYSVYNSQNNNVKLALPNKLAYSILLQKPIIVSKGTYLEKVVQEYGIGYSININDENDLLDIMKKLENNILNFDFESSKLKFIDIIKKQKQLLINLM